VLANIAAAPALPLAWRGRCERPLVGVIAVLLGAFISTLNARITVSGLADIRGALSLGFDEASWVSTVFSAAQMVVTPAAAWMSTVLSTRRVLLWTGTIFAAASLLPPFAHDYATLLGLQLIRGLAVGAFIPAALGFILRSLAPQWWIWGIAAYAFRFVFSQNIASAIEGWYADTGHWQWIFWQNVALTPVMTGLAAISMPRRPDRPRALASDRLGRDRLRRHRLRPALCRTRSGQSARLAQFRHGHRSFGRRRAAGHRLSDP
jgi:DHA2 family multidrug resistance protein